MGLMGFRKRTSFLAGLTVAQISEFSLIVVFLGNKIGHLSNEIVTLVTGVGILTFAGSTYMILNGDRLYKLLEKVLRIFERKITTEENLGEHDYKGHVILVGVNRMGRSVLSTLLSQGEKVLVVDFNPDVIKELKSKKIKSIFGDISDFEIQERAALKDARLVISTVSDLEDNMNLILGLKKIKKGPKVVAVANDSGEESVLKKAGVDYVIQPHVLGGHHIAHLIKTDSLFR